MLEEKYGLFDGDGKSISAPLQSLQKQVGDSSDFVGKGIQVPHAGKYWEWYIPDHECLAVKLALTCAFPPDDRKIQFRRTLIIDGAIGFVWSWQSSGIETLVTFFLMGESAYKVSFTRNFRGLDLDDIILATYFY